MDNKTVFVRTVKGEDETHSRTMHLPGDIKRALLMVDGTATYGEISKRAAPSLRAGLEAMLQELEKDGYIADKAKAGNIPKTPATPNISVSPKMSVPSRMVTPHKTQAVDEGGGDLDFMSGFSAPPARGPEAVTPETAAHEAVDAAKLKAEAEEKAKQEIEETKLKAQQEAEALLQKAAQEAARIREEAEHEKQRVAAKARAEAEAQALIEAKARQAAEAARIKAENEAREHAEAIAKQEIEAARVQAQREAEAALLKAEQEIAKAREEAAASLLARQKAEAMLIKSVQNTAQAKDLKEADKNRPSAPPSSTTTSSRSTSATVLFFDVIGYTKQPVNKQIEIKKQFNELVSACLKIAVAGERIILDTGDGAAIGFLQHPEDALEVAIKFRNAVTANHHLDYPDLNVRIGIHLGPINVAMDMNGRSNMVGDGINDAQRVMSFAGNDQIFISRPYYDFVSRLKDEYADMFQYRGMQADKHGREHPVYEYVGAPSAEKNQPPQAGGSAEMQPTFFSLPAGTASAGKPDAFIFDAFQIESNQASPGQQNAMQQNASQQNAGQQNAGQPVQPVPGGTAPAGKRETFSFDTFKIEIPEPATEPPKKENASPVQQPVIATPPPAETRQPVQREAPPVAASKPDETKQSQDKFLSPEQERKAVEKRIAEEELAEKLHVEAQAKAHAEAERRAAEAVKAEVEKALKEVKYTVEPAPQAAKPVHVARARRKPFSWGKLVGVFFKLAVLMLVLLIGALFAAPYVMPTRDYMPKVEKILSEKLRQPVHIGRLSGRILPTPRLELGEIYIGEMKQLQAEQALINFAFIGLLIEAKPIDSIELQGLKVSGAGLLSASAWMQQLAADKNYPVARITVGQGALEADAVMFTGVEGALDFNKLGEFTKASLRSNSGKYILDINSALGKKLQVAITVRDSALPLLPNWQFEELTAKGELSGNELSIGEFNGRISGGFLQGNANINWRSGWVAQGNIVAKTITMQHLNTLLEGNIEGSAHFKMSAVELVGLADSAVLEGSFMAKNGVISGMDIVATARLRSREHLPGGRTHFDELSGSVAYDGNVLHFKKTKITTNILNATATLDVDKQKMSGSITARLMIEDGVKQVELQVGGVTDNPILQFAP